jgi:hypothetical protein
MFMAKQKTKLLADTEFCPMQVTVLIVSESDINSEIALVCGKKPSVCKLWLSASRASCPYSQEDSRYSCLLEAESTPGLQCS